MHCCVLPASAADRPKRNVRHRTVTCTLRLLNEVAESFHCKQNLNVAKHTFDPGKFHGR
jgi:hypothetical protein